MFHYISCQFSGNKSAFFSRRQRLISLEKPKLDKHIQWIYKHYNKYRIKNFVILFTMWMKAFMLFIFDENSTKNILFSYYLIILPYYLYGV